jgi:hypothetical protein
VSDSAESPRRDDRSCLGWAVLPANATATTESSSTERVAWLVPAEIDRLAGTDVTIATIIKHHSARWPKIGALDIQMLAGDRLAR